MRYGRREKTSRESINIFTFIVSFNFQHPIRVASVTCYGDIFWKSYRNHVVPSFMEELKFFERKKQSHW